MRPYSRHALVSGGILVHLGLLVSACVPTAPSEDFNGTAGGGGSGACSQGTCGGAAGLGNGGRAGSAGAQTSGGGASAMAGAGNASHAGGGGETAVTAGGGGDTSIAGTGGLVDSGGAGATSNGGAAAGSGGAACTIPTVGAQDMALLLQGPRDLEAEVGTILSGAAAVVSVGSGFSGPGYADMKASEGGVEWLLNVPAAATYRLTWTYAEAEPRDMDLEVNCITGTTPVAFNNTGSWSSAWASDVSSLVQLVKGVNRIRLLTNGGSGPNFDKMTITPPACDLSGTTDSTCEAEAALLSGAAGPASNGSGWSGTGFADMYASEGAVNWLLNAPAAGNYRLTIFYTQQDTRDMALKINGVDAAGSPITFHNTNSWSIGWIGDIYVDVMLTLGLNSVQLSTNGGSGPNFDKLVVTSLQNTGGAGGAAGAGGATAGAGGATAGTGGATAGTGGATAGAGGATAGAGGATAGAGGATAGTGG